LGELDWQALEEAFAADDPDRYVSTFFAPRGARRALIAVYAFDLEVARIGAVAREPMAGHIRLAWWREQIGAIYAGAPPRVPSVQALASAIERHKLPRAPFDLMLDARGADLEEAPFADEASMDAHAHATSGGIVQLGARILCGDGRADEAACLAGSAAAVGGHLRDWAFFAARRRCRVPADWLDDAGLNPEDVFSARARTPALQAVHRRLGTKVREALSRLNGMRFPVGAMPVLAPAALARWAIGRRFDPLQPKIMPGWQRVARLALANLTWRV
jgi:phytoene synthase